MKKLISISIILLFYQSALSQERSTRKDFMFENPATKERIKIETGDKIAIRFNVPNVKVTGTILTLSDSSLILGISQEPYRQFVPFRNIATLAVIAQVNKRYMVRVTLKSGELLKGELVRTTRDSVSILNPRNFQQTHVRASEIKLIQIRDKKSIRHGIGLGAGTGALIGGIIGYASTPSEFTCSNCNGLNELGHAPFTIFGAIVGAGAGTLVGLAVGSAGKTFKIEGNQAQFDLFANEFKNKVSTEKTNKRP